MQMSANQDNQECTPWWKNQSSSQHNNWACPYPPSTTKDKPQPCWTSIEHELIHQACLVKQHPEPSHRVCWWSNTSSNWEPPPNDLASPTFNQAHQPRSLSSKLKHTRSPTMLEFSCIIHPRCEKMFSVVRVTSFGIQHTPQTCPLSPQPIHSCLGSTSINSSLQ